VTFAVTVEVAVPFALKVLGFALAVTVFGTCVCLTVLAADELAPLASIAVTSQLPPLVELV
jgi:hypothetical protein